MWFSELLGALVFGLTFCWKTNEEDPCFSLSPFLCFNLSFTPSPRSTISLSLVLQICFCLPSFLSYFPSCCITNIEPQNCNQTGPSISSSPENSQTFPVSLWIRWRDGECLRCVTYEKWRLWHPCLGITRAACPTAFSRTLRHSQLCHEEPAS